MVSVRSWVLAMLLVAGGIAPASAAGFTFTNAATAAVTTLEIAPVGAKVWGPNRLSAPLAQNGSFTFTVAPGEGCGWNYRATYAGGAQVTRYRVNLCRLSSAALVGIGTPKPLSQPTIRNGGDLAITAIETSAVSNPPVWSSNDLTKGPIPPGGNRPFHFDTKAGCQFDIQAIYSDNTNEVRENENVCDLQNIYFASIGSSSGSAPSPATTSSGPSPGAPVPTTRDFTFTNNYRVPVNTIIASPSNVTSGGTNVLQGQGSIVPGSSRTVQLPAKYGCKWHFEYTYDNEVQTTSAVVDICEQHTIALIGPKSGMVLSKGSAFYISPDGYLLTNNHVVYGCGSVAIYRQGYPPIPLKVVAQDTADDLAIVQSVGVRTPYVEFRSLDRPAQVGTVVLVLGFPQSFKLVTPILTSGMIGGVEGIGGDPSQFVMQTPTNPGNSGGPVLDQAGRVVGVAVATLRNAQNLNFGIKEDVVVRFAESVGINLAMGSGTPIVLTPRDVFNHNASKVVSLICRN